MTRHCQIDVDEGTARVELLLEDAVLRHPIELARIQQPYCRIQAASHAQTPRGGAPVSARVGPYEECYRLHPILEEGALTYNWGFSISAACPLNGRDADIMLRARGQLPVDSSPTDCGDLALDKIVFRPFRLHFPCEKLVLKLAFSTHGGLHLRQAGAIALESPAPGEPLRVVEHRSIAPKLDNNLLQLEAGFQKPSRLLSYALYYEPEEAGLDRFAGERRLADHLLRECRTAISDRPSALSSALSIAILHCLLKHFAVESDEQDLNLLGHIWDFDEQRLLTCFGRFPMDQWGLHLSYGCGIAGHSFRMGSNLAYLNRNDDQKALIFQPDLGVGISNLHPPPWVICIPISPGPGKAPLGVLSISSREERSPVVQELRDIATHAFQDQHANQGHVSELSAKLNLAFWTTFAEHTQNRGLQGLVKQCLESWVPQEPAAPERIQTEPEGVGPNAATHLGLSSDARSHEQAQLESIEATTRLTEAQTLLALASAWLVRARGWRQWVLGAGSAVALVWFGKTALVGQQDTISTVMSNKPPLAEPTPRSSDPTIKGSISLGGKKLYHLPNCPNYRNVEVNASKGERMFQTEGEATAAGCRLGEV